MRLMVFDIGGTQIKYCVMDETLRGSSSGSLPTPQDTQEHLFEELYEIYRGFQNEVEGIAVSLPGMIDWKKGFCNGGGWMAYNHRRSIAPELEKITGTTVRIFNDGKCAANAELTAGVLKGTENAAVYIIGTGVGGGIIIDGKIVNGRHFSAGEYSFMRMNNTAWRDPETTVGRLCSTRGLLNRYRSYAGLDSRVSLDGELFFRVLGEGDPAAQKALDDFAAQIAMHITNMTILLDLEKVAVGGGISRQPVLITRIREAVDALYSHPDHFMDPALGKPEIAACHFGSEANQVGAYLYYVETMRER